ncbi:MAG TPA: hypothetical protein VM120_02085 [Bryobacteraceae bacterium]|nr:hypothetical protein [Bryobacteraceae bacterium]
MSLEKKQNIARENGRKSHGPTTPEGKQRSSLNGITHGLASKCVVLSNESEELYTELLTGYQKEWQPASLTEQHLVTQMANAYWRLRRIWSMETALFDCEMFEQKQDFEAAWSNHHPAMRVVDAFLLLRIENPRTVDGLHRYEIRYQKMFNGSLDRLRKLRRDRNAPPVAFHLPDRPPNPSSSAAPEASPGWLARFFTMLLAILSTLNPCLRPAKFRKQARKSIFVPSEPTAPPDLPVFNFHLPEIFSWLSLFTRDSSQNNGDGKETPDVAA